MRQFRYVDCDRDAFTVTMEPDGWALVPLALCPLCNAQPYSVSLFVAGDVVGDAAVSSCCFRIVGTLTEKKDLTPSGG